MLLTALALPGVIAMSWLALPLLVDPAALPVRMTTLQWATAGQGTLLVSTAAALGASLGPRIGLSAPVLSAIVGTRGMVAAWRPRWLTCLGGGLLGAAVIVAFHAFAPESLAVLLERGTLPLPVRILYGGITEEVLLRWGLMTLLAWAGWRVFRGEPGTLSGAVAWTAIVVSALLFGIAHVPAIARAADALPIAVVVYVTLGNAVFGVVAGYLFWRRGLEAAIVAHVLAHVFAALVRGA